MNQHMPELSKNYVEIVLSKYTDKDEQWVRKNFSKACENSDIIGQPNDETTKELLRHYFDLSEAQIHHVKPQTIPRDSSIWYGRL
jgi:hypothetical protein